MKKRLIFAALAILLAVWTLYDQTGDFEFLRFDDHDYTFRCTFVKDGLSSANVAEAFTNVRHAAVWMPATYISYMADISLFGPGMGAHHLVNVAIHSANALLLLMLLIALARRMGADDPPVAICALAALFWAVHPQRAEAVAWIAGRKDLLCGFFTLAGLLFWLRGGFFSRAGAWLCCALACMSKPTAMCFPFLAMALDAFVRGDAPTASASNASRPSAHGWMHAILPYLPCLVLAAATGALAVYSQTHAEGYDVRPLFSASLPWRLLNAAVAVGLSLFQLVVPVGIHLDYRAVPGQFPLNGTLGLCSLAAAVALFAMCLMKPCGRVRVVRICALVLFFLAPLAPTLGIFGSFGEHARADRFLYMPMMAASLAVLMLPLRRLRVSYAIGAAAVIAVLALSYPLVASYRNDHTAFSRTLACDPDHGRALAHVASEECARFSHIDKGIDLYRRSQALRPRDDTAAQLSYALMMRGRSADYDEIRRLCAKFACDHSLDRKGQALEALGTTAMRQRRWNEAISCLEASIKAPLRFYSSDDAFLRLGACYANVRRTEDAIRIFEPLTQSRRADIAQNASQALATLKANPQAILFF